MATLLVCDICNKQLTDKFQCTMHMFLRFTDSPRIKTIKRMDICAVCADKLNDTISEMVARSANEVNYSFTYQDDSTFLDND